MALRSLLAPTLLLVALEATAQTPATDSVGLVVARIEQAVLSGDRTAFNALLAPGAVEGADDFWQEVTPAPERVVVKERDRSSLTDGGQRLILELLQVRNEEGRLATWDVQVRPAAPAGNERTPLWRLARLKEGSTVTGLHRLTLDSSRQFSVSKLRILAPDFELSMDAGAAFLATIPGGATAVVLLGRGTMGFAPTEVAERTQLRLFAGAATLRESFDLAMLRISPGQFAPILASGVLTPATVSAADARRANRYFEETIGRSLTLDLGDLSRERWSLVPPPGDLLTEVRTRKFGILTYARTWNQSEDVTLFDRDGRKNIAVYASQEKLAARGRFYSEDDAVDYDVESVALDADIDPDRAWIEGSASLTMVTRAAVPSLILKLAESLVVRSVTSAELGRLMFLRIAGQGSVIITPPATLPAGRRVTIRVAYGGHLASQDLAADASPASPTPTPASTAFDFTPAPRYIYSTQGYWYPQSTVHDYATATLRISLPAGYRVVASGRSIGSAKPALAPVLTGSRTRMAYEFAAEQPVPYLACVVSRFDVVSDTSPDRPAAPLAFDVVANGRQLSKARDVAERARAVLRFYLSVLGDAPYSGLTVAVSESGAPGGHGPAYVALIDQPLATSQLVWRNDPVSFPDYPSFFIAHEIAHQWWGQAISGNNYHEQWLSEGVAQYFAALYAEHERGVDTFAGVLRQMQRSAIGASDQGPISLGYRLGHIRRDSRVFRAILYNKSAMVLHMLRRLIGDEAFFTGLRNFYRDFRFKKAGTDDFRRAMERASGTDLGTFIEGWIFGSDIPHVKVSRTLSPSQLTVTFEQVGPVLPVPVTVLVAYVDGSVDTVVVPVLSARVSRAIPLRGTVRDIKIDDDHAALARFTR